jgi:hypothetical protein
MKRFGVFFVAAACALFLAQAGVAQPSPEAAPPQDAVFFVSSGAPVMPFGGKIDVLRGFGSVVGEVVKDKPYSADSITESTQILADGNRISSRNEARIFRDSAGRTRREQTLNALGTWQPANQAVSMVTINDPVADVSYFLNPADQTARQLKPFRIALDENARGAWTSAAPVAAPLPPMPAPLPGSDVGVSVHVEDGVAVERGVSVGVKPAEPFNLAVPPPGMAGVAGVRAYAPTMAMGAVAAYASNATVKNEELGEQIIEGVLVRGSRQTQTIAAGAIGNERAIDIVAEEWYSDEIEAVVLRRNLDPRFGETRYELTNIVRSEPSPDLFTVPQGYELIEDRVEGPRLGVTSGPPPAGAERAERRVFIVQPERAKDTN